MPDRRPLLAGSVGPERIPARPNPDEADWFLPLHVRKEGSARDRIATQVAAGADIVVAPAWLTHRRALLPIGETRRAAAWTAAAVRVARDAVEIGLERRETALTEAPQDDVRRARPRPLVAAPLPALDGYSEPEGGRLLPPEAATERDYRDQAGVLADAHPDLVWVEGQRSATSARVAIAEAVDTGLPVWASLGDDALAASRPEAWLEWSRGAGVERLLLPSLAAIEVVADGDLPWGGLAATAEAVVSWLKAGAGAIALPHGATVAAIEPLRAAIDDFEAAQIAARHESDSRWQRHLLRAAAMAPGGAAVWVGDPASASLPDGFDWLVVDSAAARRLPHGHYRLVIVDEATDAALGRLVEPGGILALRSASPHGREPGLRLLDYADEAEPAMAIYRRED